MSGLHSLTTYRAPISSPEPGGPVNIVSHTMKAMGVYKHIRALSRAIMVLTHLNFARESSSAAIAAAIDLPKTTTYRILQSLIDCELVYFSPSQGCFRLTPQVDTLATRRAYSGVLEQVIEPALNQLSLAVLWPSEFCAPAGSAMAIVAGTRRSSPFTLPELFVASSHPSNSPVARACFAFADPPRGPCEHAPVLADGFVIGRAPLSPHIGALAVPIRSDIGAIGALHVQWLWSERDCDAAAIDTLLPHLRAAQSRIEAAFCAAGPRTMAS